MKCGNCGADVETLVERDTYMVCVVCANPQYPKDVAGILLAILQRIDGVVYGLDSVNVNIEHCNTTVDVAGEVTALEPRFD